MAKIFADIFGGPAPSSRRSQLRAIEGGGGAVSSSAPVYTLQRLQQLWDRLRRFTDADLVQGGDAVVETVRQITEALIWGEQHDTNFFDFFCEKSILSEFIRVMGHKRAPKKVKVQLLQTLSMLVQNIRCHTSLYYLLSNNYVNKLIEMRLDFNDEEILCYYITLLKSLAMRLDGETIHFFFIRRGDSCKFPLYNESTKFFCHGDQMIRAAVRTITLQVYRIEDEAMRSFVKRHAAESYFGELARHLRELWWRLDDAISAAPGANEIERLQLENELNLDFLMYLSDMLDLGLDELNEVLADSLLNGAMLPMLLSSISGDGNPSDTGASSHRTLTLNVALFLLRQVLETIRSRVILEPLASALLQPLLDPALAFSLPGADESVLSTDGRVPNIFREHFLKCLRSNDDVVFLFAVASVHSCLRNKHMFSEDFMISARIIPASPAQSPSSTLSSFAARMTGGLGKVDNEAWDVLLLLLHGLQRHTHWHMHTFQVFCGLALEIFTDPLVGRHPQCQAAILQALHAALRASAQGVRHYLSHHIPETAARSEDSWLDVFDEEWQSQAGEQCRIAEECRDPRWLLWSCEPCRMENVFRQCLRSFLLLRRLLEDVVQRIPQDAGSTGGQNQSSVSPLTIEEASVDADIVEGSSVTNSMSDRIVCHITRAGAKLIRYLVLRDFKILLVAPDLSNPGYAFVKTAWPIWQVSSFIDRSDPRTLRLGLHAATPNGLAPGEVDSCQRNTEDGGRTGMYFTITLGFEDVERCHWADKHLQLRRQEVRSRLAQQALQYVEKYCSEPLLGQVEQLLGQVATD